MPTSVALPFLRFALIALLLAVMASDALALAPPKTVLRVGSVADVRFNTGWTFDASHMQRTRAKLQNPANFGLGGTVPFSITINDVAATAGSLTLPLLKNFDVFFIGYLNDDSSNALTGGELAALHTWVEAGGVLIVTCDDSSYDAVCADFGYPATTSASNPMSPVGPPNAIFSTGPFGGVPTFNMQGTRGFFTTTTGATVLAQDSGGNPVFLQRAIGAGRVILFADVDIVADALTDAATITNNNDKLLGNLFAYAGTILPPVRVGSVVDSRFGTGYTFDGSQLVNARAKLLNHANFGPGGTVLRPIQITDTAAAVGSITPALLANFDVFFIGYLDDANGNAFTAAELTALQNWVAGGGVLIGTCDEEGYDAVCSQFGHPATTSAENPMRPVGAGATHPVFAGPFGTLTQFLMNGTQGYFTTTAGATVLAEDSTAGTPHPVFLVKDIGAGRVFLLADVDIVADTLSAGSAINNDNDRVLANLFYAAGAPGPQLVAAVLPYSRSVQVGSAATAFATVLTLGVGQGIGCTINPVTPIAATFSYQTTSATNALVGLPNVPATIVGNSQAFLFSFTPTAAFPPTDVQLSFDCPNTSPAPIVSGLNTFLLSASNTPGPDIIALVAADGGGVVNIPGPNGAAAFAVASANIGASAAIRVEATTNGVALPIEIQICRTDPVTGQCTSAIGPSVDTTIDGGATPTFAVFVTGHGFVPFDPAVNRIFVFFKQGSAIIGATSVAVATQ